MAPRKPDIHTGALEFAQKEAIIKYCNAHPDVRYEDVTKWAQKEFNLEKAPHKSTVSRTLKNRASFLNLPIQDRTIRRKRVVKNEILEAALVTWVTQKQHQRISLSLALIQEKGKEFATKLGIPETELKCSDGWIQGFCRRNGFRSFTSHGESGNAQMTGIDKNLDYIRARIDVYDLAG